jgi:hypothetical protein
MTALDKIVDPDCRGGKHRSCVGGPCQCRCHEPGADPTDPEVVASAAPPLTPTMRADLHLLMRPAVEVVASQRAEAAAAARRRRRTAA